ncbi:MAG: PAS domain S-box protein [Gemmataceae bacterium]
MISPSSGQPNIESITQKRKLLGLFYVLGALFVVVTTGTLALNEISISIQRTMQAKEYQCNQWMTLVLALNDKVYTGQELAHKMFHKEDWAEREETEAEVDGMFRNVMDRAKRKLNETEGAFRSSLQKGLEEAVAAREKVRQSTELVSRKIEDQNDTPGAKELLAVDESYIELLEAIGKLILAVDVARKEQLQAQNSELNRLQTLYRWLGGALVLVVLALVFVGRGLVRQLGQEIRYKERTFAQLEEAELLARTVLDSVVDGVIVIDAEGKVLKTNPAIETIFGHSATEIMGERIDVLGSDIRAIEHNTNSQRGRLQEIQGKRKDGSTVSLELAFSDWKLGDKNFRTGIIRDLTEQKLAEKKLLQQALVFDNVHEGVILTDLENRITDWNPAATRIFGYLSRDVIGQTIDILTTPRSSQALTKTIYPEVLAQGRWSGEVQFTRQDGTRGTCEAVVVPLCDVAGHQVATVGVFHDITERTRAETALKETLILQRMVLDSAHSIIISTDTDGLIRSVNSTAEKMLGYPAEELVGKATPIIFHDLQELTARTRDLSGELGREIEPGMDTFFAKAQMGEAFESEWSLRRKDGTWLPVHLSVSGVRDQDGNLIGVMGVGTDITARKEAEFEREKFVSLVENSAEFIGMSTLEGDVIYINPAGREMVGLTSLNNVKATKIPDYFDEINAAKMMNEILPRVQKEGKWKGENQIRHFQTKQSFPVEQIIWTVSLPSDSTRVGSEDDSGGFSRVDSERSGPVCLATVIRDLTPQKQQEAELEQALCFAEAANQAKTDFLANMSHEVRTPMTAILGYADMLLDPELPPAQVANLLHSMRRNGTHLLHLINDVLDLTKIEAGKFDLDWSTASPWGIVLEAVSTLMIQANEKGVLLRARPVGEIPRDIVTDPLRLRQILVNLLNNAIKFTPSGKSVDVRLVAEKRLDRSSDTSSGNQEETGQSWLRFEVEDTGIGMTPGQIARLFQPFEQGDTSTTRQFGGTGLGLSISKRLALLFGGDILVESELNKGSLFTFRLPLRAEANVEWVLADDLQFDLSPEGNDEGNDLQTNHRIGQQELDSKLGSAPSSMSLPAFSKRYKVLLADDSKDNQRVLRYLLEKMGLEVDLADNGEIAVSKALAGNHDVVLMDMAMPELDGYGAASCLRNQQYTKPIVALTAHAMSGDRDRCLRAGCSDYLTKPVTMETLQTTLLRHLLETPLDDVDLFMQPKESQVEVIHSTYAENLDFLPLVREYAQTLQKHSEEIRSRFAAGHLDRVQSLAHQIKGASGMYGYHGLGETAKLIESAINEGENRELIGELIEELAVMIVKVERAFRPEG